jgi:hypothetical protein
MLLTLLQSQGVIPPPFVQQGGGPGTSQSTTARRKGWAREREIFEESLRRFDPDHQTELRRIAQTLTDSNQPQAQRIARKLADYTGEIDQVKSLQRELGKLEAAQRSRITTAQRDADLQAAALELREILRDEEDILTALIAIDEFDSRAVFTVFGLNLH